MNVLAAGALLLTEIVALYTFPWWMLALIEWVAR